MFLNQIFTLINFFHKMVHFRDESSNYNECYKKRMLIAYIDYARDKCQQCFRWITGRSSPAQIEAPLLDNKS